MKTRRWFWFTALILAAVVFAPLGQILVESLIIQPVTRVWWTAKQIFISLGQLNLWYIYISMSAIIALLILIRWMGINIKTKEKQVQHRGPVETLALNISRTKGNSYFKWLIANRLSELTLCILKQKTNNFGDKHKSFSDIPWDPPVKVRKYLETGLQNSFLEFRSSRLKDWVLFPIMQSKADDTPFDIDLHQIVNYIESQMELTNE